MANLTTYLRRSPGARQPFAVIPMAPHVDQRDPINGKDKAFFGQQWINETNASVWCLINETTNSWVNLTATSGGAGAFTTLTSSGQTTINTSGAATNTIGNANAASLTTITGGNASMVAAQGGLVFSGPSISVAGPGDTTFNSGCNVIIAGASNYLQINTVKYLVGAGAPGAPLADAIGNLYINTAATTDSDRIYIATAVGTWTNLVAAA